MTRENQTEITIYPPEKPLELPLNTQLVCAILEISKSTLIRWENQRKIKRPNRAFNLRASRMYDQEAIISIMRHMKQETYVNGQPMRPWIQDIDLNQPGTITTPSGFRITINSSLNRETE